MANEIRKITLTNSAGGSGPNYKVEWSINGTDYSESIDCGNISLPGIGSFVTCSIDSAANYLRLTSLNIFCDNEVSNTIIPTVGPCNSAVYTIIESGQVEDPAPANTYQYTDAFGVVRSGSLGQYESIMVGARTGSATVTGVYSTVITSSIDYCNQTFTCVDCNTFDITNTSNNVGSLRNKDIALFYVPCGSSSLDYVLFKSPFDTDSTLAVSGSVCACNSVYQFVTGSTPDGPSGSLVVGGVCEAPSPVVPNKILELNYWNKTTESIDSASIQFTWDDGLGRIPGNQAGYFYYITQSNIPVGKSTYYTPIYVSASSFTGSDSTKVESDPDTSANIIRYNISGSALTDGTFRVGVSSNPTTSLIWSFLNSAYINPSSWATMSVDITSSYSSSDEKTFIIESQNNTTYYAGTASQDDIVLNRFETFAFTQDEYPSGFKTTSTTGIATGSNPFNTFVGWPKGPYRLSVTQSLFLDNVLITTSSAIYNLGLTTGNSLSPGNINYDNYQVIKSYTEINDAPLTGSRLLEYRVENNTSESIDTLWWAFDFNDTPNQRVDTTPDGILTGYRYYVSASNVPTGSSVYTTLVNFTASLVQPPQDYNLYMDPDTATAVARYNFDGIIRQDGVQQATFNAQSASVFNQFPTASYLNPMTWATCSFELTASLTSSAPEPTSSLCYEIETVQSSQGECFDCPGFFASTTDTILHIFDECSGSEIFPPVDIFVESRYSDNSTSSLFIPTGYTESIIIATSDTQCIPAPECGEDASPTFLSASIVALTGSIVECCV